MDQPAAHQWERTEVRDNARVHQGDAYANNNFYLAAGSVIQVFADDGDLTLHHHSGRSSKISCLHGIEPTRLDKAIGKPSTLPKPSKLIHSSSTFGREVRLTNHKNIPISKGENNLGRNNYGDFLVNEALRSTCSANTQTSLTRSVKSEKAVANHQGVEEILTALNHHDGEQKDRFMHLIDRIRANPLFPLLASISPKPGQQTCDQIYQAAASTPPVWIETSCMDIHRPAQDLAATLLAILTFLACNNALEPTGPGSLIVGQQGRKLSLLPALVAFAIARYLCFPRLAKAISDLSGGYAIIQDPFLIDIPVPVSHCEDFEMVRAFLRVRLAGTAAEAFIKTEQFNLTLGRREGPAIRKTDWSVKGRDWSNRKVVMSVFVRKGEAKCIECDAELKMHETGHFAWYVEVFNERFTR